ncbi:hypothetical protein JXA70_19095 [candidate division KSB1 bacterium]|nr:hypothetical protein [candidate division KSB1 bacterium]
MDTILSIYMTSFRVTLDGEGQGEGDESNNFLLPLAPRTTHVFRVAILY